MFKFLLILFLFSSVSFADGNKKSNLNIIRRVTELVEKNMELSQITGRGIILSQLQEFKGDKKRLKEQDILKAIFPGHCLSLLGIATLYGFDDVAHYLVSEGADPNSSLCEKNCMSPFVIAFTKSYRTIWEPWLEKDRIDLKKSISYREKRALPIQIAIDIKDEEVALRLFKKKNTTMTIADAELALSKKMGTLCLEYFQTYPRDFTAQTFFLAAKTGITSLIIWAFDERKIPIPNFMENFEEGKTPLMAAMERGHTTVVHLLLRHTNFLIRDSQGRHALHYALRSKNIHVLNLYLQAWKKNADWDKQLTSQDVESLMKTGMETEAPLLLEKLKRTFRRAGLLQPVLSSTPALLPRGFAPGLRVWYRFGQLRRTYAAS